MQISSSGYQNPVHGLAPAARSAAVAAPGAAPEASTVAGQQPSLFSGGQFVGVTRLTAPETLAALFQLNDDGSVKLSDLGAPVMKKGVTIQTPQDDMAKFLALGSPDTWSASDRDAASRLSLVTESDKAMFREITGYNLFISGPAALILDDEGNAPSAADRETAEELFARMQFARESGVEIDAEWFSGISKDIAKAGGPTFPADWAAQADDWFDDHFAARRENADRVPAPALDNKSQRASVDAYVSAANLREIRPQSQTHV
ncbi:hypothetical protein [Brevundimonas sp.]|uniref:hypothetical protein n=1 Tax=Brevundimonas sp. TaxID=1871086 RepID=UPI00391D2DE5